MNGLHKIIIPLLSIILLASCEEPKPRAGCTDPTALNYNPLSEVDDGTCEYTDSTITIWNEGKEGVWGSSSQTGHIEMQTCFGYSITDTTDTFPGEGLIIIKDSAGDFGIASRVINSQDARSLGNGHLVFDLLVPASSNLENFDVFIHGKNCSDIKMCDDVCRSGGVTISTIEIDSVGFTEVAIPLLEFENRYLQKLHTPFGFRENVQGGNDTVMVINNIRWETLYEAEEE